MTFKNFNLRRSLFLYSFLVIYIVIDINAQTPKNKIPWSVRMADSEIKRKPANYYSWGYVEGTVLKGIEELWRTSNDEKYFSYIKTAVQNGFQPDGTLKSYNFSDYSLDEICEGRMLLIMVKEGLSTNFYQNAIDTLRKQIKLQPRTYDGGFWHRNNSSGRYPHQMWLDGVYMANPFYAEYGLLFNEPADFDDVITQITVMEKHARDPQTGLLYHGWDESKTQSWADPVTGCSPAFWGRADGWYAMAVIDILDYLPMDYSGRDSAIAIIQRLAEALKKVQDPVFGTWYQVLDQGTREGNYRESSASSMFVYMIAKAVRLGYINKSYWDVVKKGYSGMLNEFITTNSDSTINLTQTCITAGLGFGRDGTFEYYTQQTQIQSNDGKGTGPFILASIEVEKAGLVVPPLNLITKINGNGSVTISWNDKSYNAVDFHIERKSVKENEFIKIGSVNKGTNSFTDNHVTSGTKYYYRAIAYSNSDSSDYSNTDTVTAVQTDVNFNNKLPEGFQLLQNYPNPFNPSTTISFTVPPVETHRDASLQRVTLRIYDTLGREIETLADENKFPGNYSVVFNGKGLPSGTYFYKLSLNNFSETKKMILLK